MAEIVRIKIVDGNLALDPETVTAVVGTEVKWKRGQSEPKKPKVEEWTVTFSGCPIFARDVFKGKKDKEDGDKAEESGSCSYTVTAVDEDGNTYEISGPPFVPRIVISDPGT